MHIPITGEPGAAEAAEASATVARACYNLALRRAMAGDDRLPDPPATSGRRDSAAAHGPPNAHEPPSPVRRFPGVLAGAGRVSPSAAMVPPPPDTDPSATPQGEDGFDRFLREHRGPLVAFLSRRIGEDDAQDIAQEALVRLMRYRGQPVEQLRPLMYRIAINVIHDRGRRDSTRQVFAHVSLDQDFIGLASLEPSHDQRIEHEQELALVRAAILQLPERCRQVYLLNRLEGLSYTQIAQHCGISVKAVEKHIGKALAMLRAKLKQSGVDREERT